MFHLTLEKMTDKQPHNSETTTVSSEKIRAPPAVPSLILINLAVRQFSEVCKYLHQAEEETSVKRPHAPLPDTKGSVVGVGLSSHFLPLRLSGLVWFSPPTTSTQWDTFPVLREALTGLYSLGTYPPTFSLGVLCSKQSFLLLLFYFFPQFSRKLSFAAGEEVPQYK